PPFLPPPSAEPRLPPPTSADCTFGLAAPGLVVVADFAELVGLAADLDLTAVAVVVLFSDEAIESSDESLVAPLAFAAVAPAAFVRFLPFAPARPPAPGRP